MEKYRYNKAEEEFLKRTVVPLAVYQLVDEQIVTIVLTQGFFNLFGYNDADATYSLMDNDMYRNVHPDDVSRLIEASVRFIRDDEPYNVIFRSVREGKSKLIHAYGMHIYPEEGVRLAVVWYMSEGKFESEELSDDTFNKYLNVSITDASLQMKQNYDPLTGLPNMSYFFELAAASRINVHEATEQCCICYANLNGVKFFNRKYGFAEGDKLIRSFAEILKKIFGEKNCSRIGQDNFAFFGLLDEVEEKLESVFKELSEYNGGKTTSARVGIYPDYMGIVETNMACDRARFACNTLRNIEESTYIYFDKEMLDFENRRQYVIDNLDRAIEEGWIQAFYQPIIRTANGRASDEEALARWIDPEKGMLSPADFIPILEDSKLIYKLDLHIVDLVIEKLKRQKEEGLYLVPTSVNLSRTDFDVLDIVEAICKKLDDAGIDHSLLTIEITESVVGSDFEYIKEQVDRFQKLGFRVWMDDFGSGYSSLDVLQGIHFDLIKLDMRFMKQFNNDEKSKIIITELVKMAMGLGIETVSEGVETEEQVEFLEEVGCTKQQGFYYSKPLSIDELYKKMDEGGSLGFENPEETTYYEAIGRINLYDMSSVLLGDSDQLDNYFNTLPMAIVESTDTDVKFTRCNQAYRDFYRKIFGTFYVNSTVPYSELEAGPASVFARAFKRCADEGGKIFIRDKLNSDMMIHSLVSRIASNPVGGTYACAIVVLGINKQTDQGVTYNDIANSLSADYLNLYYVDLDTEEFVEYRPDSTPGGENLTVERHDTRFFRNSCKDALVHIYKDDVDRFIKSFNKENIVSSIEEYGSFTLTYRLLIDGTPTYVHMKAIPMTNDASHIIIGVANVDAQMKQQEKLERMQEEQTTFARYKALSNDIICIYVVDPVTNEYNEYNASKVYADLGIEKNGEDFFKTTLINAEKVIHPDDIEYFKNIFTKENMMRDIEENGVFQMNYRLVAYGKTIVTGLRAVRIEEKDGPQIIVGVSDIGSQVMCELK